MQQIIEQFSESILVMVLFACWLVPVLAAIIVWTVGNSPIEALYFASLFPFVGLFLGCGLLLSDETVGLSTDVLPDMVAHHGMPILLLSILLYGSVAVALLGRARRRWRKIKKLAGVAPQAPRVALPVPDEPASVAAPAYAAVQPTPTNPPTSHQ
ncbi:MAG: hypothetical protein AAGB26_00215 [Planctomycetota bacterium]